MMKHDDDDDDDNDDDNDDDDDFDASTSHFCPKVETLVYLIAVWC